MSNSPGHKGHKGLFSQIEASKRITLIRNGHAKPIEYTDTLDQAWEKAGLMA